MRILIMKFRNIGDVLLVTPLISNLKRNYPDAKIDVAVNRGTEEMLTLHPDVDEVLIYDRAAIKSLGLFRRILAELRFAWKIRKRGYDLVINTTKGDRGAQLALISGAETKIGYASKNRFLKRVFDHTLPAQGLRHTIETNLDPLRVLKLPVAEKRVEIFWSETDEKTVDALLPYGDFVHIHPVSRWLFKCLDDASMARIIDYCILELRQNVVLTAAPVRQELDKVASILAHCKSRPTNLAGKLTLKQTAALNKRARRFIGVDTAIMHISAANDVPVLAFFGPSGADHWGPWDNELMESGYTSRRGIQRMGKHIVWQRGWECVPCGKDGCEGSKISDCLIHLEITELHGILSAHLKGGTHP